MAIRVGINGFGRIGRLVFAQSAIRDCSARRFEVVAVNDIVPADNLAYLVKYDSTQGKFPGTRDEPRSPTPDAAEDDVLVVNGQEIKCLAVKDGPAALPWKATRRRHRDRVAPASSPRRRRPRATSTAGAKKVIIIAPRPRTRTSPSSWA